jgi:hypothetical protein
MAFGKKLSVVIATMGAAALAAALVKLIGGPTTPTTPGAPAPGAPAPGAPGGPAPGGPQKPGTKTTPPTYKPGQFTPPGGLQPGAAPSSPLPSGVKVPSDGKAGSLTGPQSIADIVEDLKQRDAGKFAKYARFLRFAGPAAAAIPALIKPVMMIANGEPEDEIKREIGVALGTVSGAVPTLISAHLDLGPLGSFKSQKKRKASSCTQWELPFDHSRRFSSNEKLIEEIIALCQGVVGNK